MSYGRGDRYQSRDGDSNYIRLSNQISSNTFTIQRQVNNAQKMITVIGTKREGARTQHQMNALLEETKELIKDTTSMLKELNHLDGGSPQEQRSRSLEQKKLRDDLDAVAQQFKLAYRSALKKEQDTLNRERAESVRGGASGFDGFADEEDRSLLDSEEQQRRQQLVAEVDINTAQIEEREQGMRELESQMTEVNDIFKDIANIVQEQGDMLDSIEGNLTQTYDRVDRGTTELTHASRYQKKARNKAMCLLVIVVIVAGILAAVLATSLKKKK